jgi:hypothetical protein
MNFRRRLTVKTAMTAVALAAIFLAMGIRYSRHWGERRYSISVHRGLAETFAREAGSALTPAESRGDLVRMAEGHDRRADALRWVPDFDPKEEYERLNDSRNSR